MNEHDHLLTPQQAAEHLGLTVRYLEARRHRGGGPAFVKISKTRVRYRIRDLNDFVSERVRTSTSDLGRVGNRDGR